MGEWPGRIQEEPGALHAWNSPSQTCGLPDGTLKTVAHMIAEANGVCILWAMGVTQHSMGSDTSTAISNLLLVTGNYMRPGTGAYPLRGHNNVQGASDHGAMPNFLPGYQSVDDPEVRARFEAAWKVQLPSTKGLDNHEMIDAIHRRQAQGDVPVRRRDEPGGFQRELCRATRFRKLDFFVVQDIFFSDTCQYADVVLPASPSLEKEGTFTSTERRIQRLYQVFEPLGESRPDWQIIQDIANRLGADWNYQHPSEIYRGDRLADADVCRRDLRTARRIQVAAMAGGARMERDQPLLYTKQFTLPGWQGEAVPRVLERAHRPAGRAVRSAFEQRPPARTFSRRQHDLPHRGNPQKRRTRLWKFRRNLRRSAGFRAERGCN